MISLTRASLVIAVSTALAPAAGWAQSAATAIAREPQGIADAVWAAVQPALPYPAARDDDTPVDGREEVVWVVRRLDEGERVLEVIANPLNPENQSRAAKAMAEIQASVAAAERRAQADYERKLGTTSPEQRTRDVIGISLDDEGVAGERADWTAKLIVEGRAADTSREWHPPGPASPEQTSLGRAVVLSIAEAEYDEAAGGERRRRYRPAESRLRFGNALEVVLKGNATLIKDVLAKSDWSRIAALAP